MEICKTLCRLCACEDCCNIKINNNLKEHIQKYLNLYVQPTDITPQFVCKLCAEKLECFNSFANECLKVQIFYNEIISKKIITKIELEVLKTEFRIKNIKSSEKPNKSPLQTVLEENKNTNDELDFGSLVKIEHVNIVDDNLNSLPLEEKRKRGRPRGSQNKYRRKEISRRRRISLESGSENFDDDFGETDEGRIDNSYKENDKYKNENKIKTEAQFREYKCGECDESFTAKLLLNEHIKIHTSKEKYPYICYHCGSQHSTELKLKRHEIAHIPQEERQIYPCPHCEKRFMKPQAVDIHIKSVHLQERPFVCHQCGRAFSSKGTLNEHLLIHSDVTPFACDCGKKFKTMHRLKLHSDTHRDTQYECPVCFLQLNTKRTLRQHLVIHKEVRAYTCKVCLKSFKRYKGLKTHEILHSGRRPYICPFCDRTFTNGSNCRSHKRRMHPKELAEYEKTLQISGDDGGHGMTEYKLEVNAEIAQGLQDQNFHDVNITPNNSLSTICNNELSRNIVTKYTFTTNVS